MPEATSQAIPTVSGLGTSPKVLQILHQFRYTASMLALEYSEGLIEEPKAKILKTNNKLVKLGIIFSIKKRHITFRH